MNTKEKLILLLDEIVMSYKVSRFIIENFDAEKFVLCVDDFKEDIENRFGKAVFLKLKNAISIKNIEKTALELEKSEILALFLGNEDYPKELLKIQNPPLVIYYVGDKSLLNKPSIAIVGTRKPTNYGREVTRLFACELSKAGLVTVSGLAYGLDMEVAISTLEVKGKTIAVLGGGLDKIYPEQNTNLARDIVKNGGLLISLYPPKRRPTKYSFVERNAIISGLSLGTVIIEAGESSGTLNTANHTIEQGKELFVVPANITSLSSVGSNKLIEELPETFTISPRRVLKVLGFDENQEENQKKIKEISVQEKVILEALYDGELDFDSLQEKTKIESKSLISLLTMMEISGLIKKLPGNFYSL